MRSFISSFRPVALWAVFTAGTYVLAIEAVQPRIEIFPDPQTANLVKAQRYLYSEKLPDIVLTGSSLSQRLPDRWLPEGTFNLAFSGESALTGLAIIAQAPVLPKRIYVETNLLVRDVEAPFVAQIASEGILGLARHVRAFRSEYRPINVILAQLMGQTNLQPRASSLTDDCANRLAEHRNDTVSQKTVERMLQERLPQNAKIPDLTSQMKNLRSLVGKLEARGTKIELFEMPVDARLSGSATYVALRAAISQALPGKEIRTFKSVDFTTTDGAHPAPESAIRIACLLLSTETKP